MSSSGRVFMSRYSALLKASGSSATIWGLLVYLAEAVRFELTKGCPLPVFKTGAFNHSATLPEGSRQV